MKMAMSEVMGIMRNKYPLKPPPARKWDLLAGKKALQPTL
jgi:hypothetical protein